MPAAADPDGVFDTGTLAAFLPAVLAVVVAPGPDTIYTLVRSLGDGRTAGVVAGLGTATGVLIHTAAAVLGLSALLRTSAGAYTLVKYVGAAYLVYLGLRTLRRDGGFELDGERAGRSPRSDPGGSLAGTYRRAVLVNVTNPKVAVFVLAFLPQFVAPTGDASLQLSLLGLAYAAVSLLYLALVALFAGHARYLLFDSDPGRRMLRYASGSVLVGFGVALALGERPAG